MNTALHRVVALPGALLLGLGSMVCTGVFVSIGIAAESAGGAVIAAVMVAAALALTNSAFTVLVYHALTNRAALRMPAELQRVPRWVPGLGLVGCLTLGAQIDPMVAAAGVGVRVLGLAGRAILSPPGG